MAREGHAPGSNPPLAVEPDGNHPYGEARLPGQQANEMLQVVGASIRMARKRRRMTRQGAKFGLHGEFGMQHLDAFYEVYAHSVHALGSPVFPRLTR